MQPPRAATLRLLATHLSLDPIESADLVEAATGPPIVPPTVWPPRTPHGGLPDDLKDFTGRDEIVRRVFAALRGDRRRDDGPTLGRLVQISGPAGVGKTAVAIHVAHQLQPYFPDGCLYLDLRGRQDRPLQADEAVSQLLSRCLHGERSLPDESEERRALLRATLAGRRLLIVLDNVDSESQVRPVLAILAGVAVLLTGRRTLAAFDNLGHQALGLFDLDESVALLRSVVGSPRVAAEPDQAVRVAELCGRVPLAVRLAATRLVARPHWGLGRLVEQLADEHLRLDTLTVGDRAIRASLELSSRSLGPSTRSLFHLLGALTDTDLPGWVAGPLLDRPRPESDEALEQLVESRLVDVEGSAAPRYGMHVLVRLYARECAPTDLASLRPAAERYIGSWLSLVEQAARRLGGGPPWLAAGAGVRYPLPEALLAEAAADPTAWFEREDRALSGAITTAVRLGLHEQVADLVGGVGRYLELVGDLERWQQLLRLALDGVRRSGNRRREAYLLRSLAEVLLDRDEYPAARECLVAARDALVEIGDADAVVDVERALGYLERVAGNLSAAAERLETAVRHMEAGNDLTGRADAYFSLGLLRQDQGRFPEALIWYQQALAVEDVLGNRVNQTLLRCSIGSVHLMEGAIDGARAVLVRALADARETDHTKAFALTFLGAVDTRSGDYDAADQHLARALSNFDRSGDRHGKALALRNLAELRRVQGRLDEALETVQKSLRLWRDIRAPVQYIRSLVTLGPRGAGGGGAGGAAPPPPPPPPPGPG